MLERMDATLTAEQIQQAGLEGWSTSADALHSTWDTGDFAAGLALVNAIGAAAEEMNHHPDLELSYPSVGVHLSSHDVGGVTERDLTLARTISELAASAGVAAHGNSPAE